MRRRLQYHFNTPSNTPSVPLPHSGAALGHMRQLSPPPNPDSDLSAGSEIYLVHYADEMDQISSCERLMLPAQQANLCVFYISISQFFATDSFVQRNYHATGKQAATSSRPPKIHATQQPSTSTQNTLPLSQQPPHTRITIDPGWRARIVRWVCCMPIQNTDGQR
jgi:hypothetical protein